MGRANQTEMALRITEVKEALLLGDTRCDIFQLGSKWDVDERTIDNYIGAARKEILEANNASYEENRALIIKNLWEVYKDAKKVKDLREQRSCLAELVKVTGLAEIRIKNLVEKLEDVNPVEAEQALLTEMAEFRH